MECWDVEVKAGQPFKFEVEPGRIIHITQAELCEQKDGEGSDLIPVFVEINGKSFVIASLSSENIPQVNFDLVFEKDVVLSHGAKNGSIYFRGYSTANLFLVKERAGFGNCESKLKPSAASKGKSVKPESSTKEMQDASDDDDLSGSEDDEDEDSSEDEEEEAPKKVESSKKRSKESAEKTPVPTKKAKTVIPNKTGIQQHCMYKNLLQEYTEKASISLPRYTIGEIEGPQRMPMFSSIVLVDGEHYTSSCSFGTRKAAEQDAARVALNAISDKLKNAGSPLLVHKQHGMYKNCLQEYTQKASISLPRYTIGKIEGLKHKPTFSSIVLVDGESYTSSCSFGTRKAAEQDAARVALNAISDKIKNAGCPFLVHKDMQDASDDDDLSGSEDDEDEDSSEDEEEETPKKVESSKKRSKESAEKTSVPTKKAKTVKPQKKGFCLASMINQNF